MEKERLTPEDKIAVLGKILSALSEAHGQGVVHRDLKPENILIDFEGNPKVTDFDCAYVSSFSTLTSISVPGTLHYMSPERLNEPTSRYPDDDIYAFGMIALELLSGLRHQSYEEMLGRIDAVPQFRRLRTILMRCIARRSQGRYVDAKLLERDWNAIIKPVDLGSASEAIIIGPNTPINYTGQNLAGHVFDQQHLRGSIFREAILQGSSFRQTVLSEAVLLGADLRDCCFDGAFMIGARFQNAKIGGATFRMANLERTVWDNVDLEGVDFTGANFWGAILMGAINLHRANLTDANFARNVLSGEQETFLKNATDITRADNYPDFFELARSRFSGALPVELWWSRIADDPDSMIEFY